MTEKDASSLVQDANRHAGKAAMGKRQRVGATAVAMSCYAVFVQQIFFFWNWGGCFVVDDGGPC